MMQAMMMMKRLKIAVAVLSFGVCALFLYFFFYNKALIQTSFISASYYLILVLFLFWIATLAKAWANNRPDFRSIVRSYGVGILFCLLACALIFVSVKPQFRILADETNLLAVSRSMTFEHRVDNVTMGNWYYSNFQPMNRETDKRPLLYPFLTSLIHTTTGFRPENAFAVNFILLAGLLMMVFILVQRACGASWAYGAVILVLANPVVTQSATSGGIELCATFFTAASLVSLFYFLKAPDALRFQILWANLLMLANTRYESALFFVILASLLFFMKYIPGAYWGQAWIFPVTPALFLPWIWQRMIFVSHPNPFELKAGEKAFSVGHLLNHTKDFFMTGIRFDYSLPYAVPVLWLGMIGLFFLSFKTMSSRLPKHQQKFIFLSALALLAIWVTLTAYFFGIPSQAADSRFFVPFAILLSLGTVYFLSKVLSSKIGASFFLLFSILVFLLYHPQSVENRFCNSLILTREHRLVMDFLEEQPGRNFLIIAERPGMYTAKEYGAVDFNYANSHKEDVLLQLRRHLYRDIFVAQEILYEGLLPTKASNLDPQFQLSPILELQNNAVSFIRISRVKA